MFMPTAQTGRTSEAKRTAEEEILGLGFNHLPDVFSLINIHRLAFAYPVELLHANGITTLLVLFALPYISIGLDITMMVQIYTKYFEISRFSS